MSMETKRIAAAEDWTTWENQVIGGVFPLRRFLGRSDHSVVFLTECKAHELPNAAIKLIPADPAQEEAQLSRWSTAAGLSHPHLIRLLNAGRCTLSGHPFLYVVMEHAEQTLAQILPQRALTPDELRETLIPTLDVLAFLHRNNLVHGQLKPANFLVVNDQLKLASDTVRPSGESRANAVRPSVYDPPEAKTGAVSAAGDMWGLGMTIAEALTQIPPGWPDDRSGTASLPATLPAEFVETVRRCLSHDPAGRPSVADLELGIKPAPPAPVVSVAGATVSEAPRRVTPASAPARVPQAPRPRLLVQTVAVGLAISLLVWAGLRLSRGHSSPQQVPAQTSAPVQQPAPTPIAVPAPPPTAVAPNPRAPLPAPNSVLHQEMPVPSRGARESIHGHIKVAVRVNVDRSGTVVGESLENTGPSRYFAHLATEAAKKWKFAPSANQEHRAWVLRFEFTRGGTTGHAVARS